LKELHETDPKSQNIYIMTDPRVSERNAKPFVTSYAFVFSYNNLEQRLFDILHNRQVEVEM